MSEEELLQAFALAYPGVYLSVQHTCRLFDCRPRHEWTFWHAEANEHVGPYATAEELAKAVAQWEGSGERAAACAVQEVERSAQQRRGRLARQRMDAEREAERKATHDVGSALTYQRAAEAERVADASYTPTVEEACRNPEEFVEGMTEESFQMDPRD